MIHSFKDTEIQIKAFIEEIKKRHNGKFGEPMLQILCGCRVILYRIDNKNDPSMSHICILAYYCSHCEAFIEGRGRAVFKNEGCTAHCPICKSIVMECSATNQNELSNIGWSYPPEKAD